MPQPLRVLDMACGSGSFLLGAYQCLLDHCLSWYIANGPEGFPKAVYAARSGGWRLTIGEKKRILTTHLFGVDIDPQAVEVSKLSLLLKVLEGESAETVGDSMRLFHERALPNLSDNIKCGNSLIGPDYFTGRLIPDAEELTRVNAFDWKREFPDAMKAGGFDCIIGNPPYIRIQTMKETAPLEVEIYKELFKTAREGNYDIYVVFIERGLTLLNAKGRLGFICPHKFFNAKYGAPVRGVVADGQHLAHVVHFGDQQVFDGATTYTCLLFLDKAPAKECLFVQVKDLARWKTPLNGKNGAPGEGAPEEPVAEGTIPASQVSGGEWNSHVGNGAALFRRLNRVPTKLGDIADIFVGLQTSADRVYVLKDAGPCKRGFVRGMDAQGKQWLIERGIVKPFLSHVTVSTYSNPRPGHWLIFPYDLVSGKAVVMREKEIPKRFPMAWKYLQANKELLRQRENGKASHGEWYAYIYRKNLTLFAALKLIVQVISLHGRYAYDEHGTYFTGGGNGPYYAIRWTDPDDPHSLHYLQGLLNSPLLDYFLRRVSSPFRGGYWSYGKRFIEQLPIRRIDFSIPADKAAHDRMVKLVDSMLALHKQLGLAKGEAQRGAIQRQIEATDAEIDRLVYDLYGLTDEEIAIVEGRT